MKLAELEPQFIRHERRDDATYHVHVDTIGQAQGIFLLCPACFRENGGPARTHGIVCWSRSRGVPNDAVPGPGRWALEGTGYHDLTLNGDGGSRSVLLTGAGCKAHFFVTNGEIQLC